MDLVVFTVYLLACMAAAATGSLFPPGEWWKSLRKPWFTPPDIVFPLAWMAIYTMSAVAAARVADETGNALPMALWALQIALNTLWSPVFFGLHRPRASVVIVTSLWVTVVATCVAFFPLDPVAGWLMVPYIVWLTVASGLNIGVIILNPNEGRAATPAE
ncbi:MAG: TspO/MBR family protein [Pseudomonadota bacterium]